MMRLILPVLLMFLAYSGPLQADEYSGCVLFLGPKPRISVDQIDDINNKINQLLDGEIVHLKKDLNPKQHKKIVLLRTLGHLNKKINVSWLLPDPADMVFTMEAVTGGVIKEVKSDFLVMHVGDVGQARIPLVDIRSLQIL